MCWGIIDQKATKIRPGKIICEEIEGMSKECKDTQKLSPEDFYDSSKADDKLYRQRNNLSSGNDRISEIDGLRGIALIAVLGYHAKLSRILVGGFLGVDVFFVISGYVITLSLLKKFELEKFSFSEFIVRRIIRLLPALAVTIAVSNVVSTFIFIEDHSKAAAFSSISSISAFSNVHLWMESSYFDMDSNLKPFLHTWSLSVEWQFYLTWAFLAKLIYTRIKSVKYQICSLLSISIFSLICTSIVQYGHKSAAFYNTIFRYDEFTCGAIMAWVTHKINSDPGNQSKTQAKLRILSSFLSFIGVLAHFFLFQDDLPFPGFTALPICVFTGILIYCGKNMITELFLQNNAVLWIGKISYSVYLVHWPILVFVNYFKDLKSNDFDRIACIIASIPIGALLNFCIEVPFQRYLSRTTALSTLAFIFAVILCEARAMIYMKPTKNYFGSDILKRTEILNLGRFKEISERHGLVCHGIGVLKGNLRFNTCNPESEKEILLLGDSHAADLYKALNEVLDNTTVVQVTAPSCNLHSSTRKPKCYSVKNVIKRYLKPRKNRIKAIIIGSKWNGMSLEQEKTLRSEVDFLKKKLNNSNFIIVGPRPKLSMEPKQLLKIGFHSSFEELEYKFNKSMNMDLILSQKLSQFCIENNYTFVNAFEAVCTKAYPLDRVPSDCSAFTPDRKYLMYFDMDHFNIEGAKRVVALIYPRLAQILRLPSKK